MLYVLFLIFILTYISLHFVNLFLREKDQNDNKLFLIICYYFKLLKKFINVNLLYILKLKTK
jgi:hypothetical protein